MRSVTGASPTSAAVETDLTSSTVETDTLTPSTVADMTFAMVEIDKFKSLFANSIESIASKSKNQCAIISLEHNIVSVEYASPGWCVTGETDTLYDSLESVMIAHSSAFARAWNQQLHDRLAELEELKQDC